MIYRPGMEEYEDQEANSGLAEYELAGVIYTDKEGGRIMLRVMIGGKKYVSVISQVSLLLLSPELEILS